MTLRYRLCTVSILEHFTVVTLVFATQFQFYVLKLAFAESISNEKMKVAYKSQADKIFNTNWNLFLENTVKSTNKWVKLHKRTWMNKTYAIHTVFVCEKNNCYRLILEFLSKYTFWICCGWISFVQYWFMQSVRLVSEGNAYKQFSLHSYTILCKRLKMFISNKQ